MGGSDGASVGVKILMNEGNLINKLGENEKWSTKICLLGKDSWIRIVHKTDSDIHMIDSVLPWD